MSHAHHTQSVLQHAACADDSLIVTYFQTVSRRRATLIRKCKCVCLKGHVKAGEGVLCAGM